MSETRTVVLLGGGGHAAVVAESARTAGWAVAGYLDDDPATAAGADEVGLSRLGSLGDLTDVLGTLPPETAVHAAVGDPAVRRELLAMAGSVARSSPEATIVHATAIVSPSASVAPAVFIGPGAIVNARARIGRGAIVNTGAIVEHDCALGEFCHIAPGAVLAGTVTVGADSLVGAGAAVQPGIEIGRSVSLGAGAVATTDIPDGVRAAGVPARDLSRPRAQASHELRRSTTM